jgi:hypothetical protein
MTDEEKSKRRVELMKKRLTQGLTLTEAHELSMLDNVSEFVPWKQCDEHKQSYLYGRKCPICIE